MLQLLTTLLTGKLGDVIGNAADKYLQNEADKEAFKNEVELAVLKQTKEIEGAASGIVMAEAKSEHWLTATWRPIAALVMVLAIFLNLVAVPVAAWFGINIAYELPPEVWTTFNVMLGGYVVSRGAEKVMENYNR